MSIDGYVDRRSVLIAGAAGAAAFYSRAAAAQRAIGSGLVLSVTEFGARPGAGFDSTAAIQSAINEVSRRGGGTVVVPGRFVAGNLRIPADGVTLQGQSGQPINARVTVPEGVQAFKMADLSIIDTRADHRTYLLDVSGRDCTFSNVRLTKDPIAGGYQMYLRQSAQRCRFSGLTLKGSNGVMVAGIGHLFEDFDFTSTMTDKIGGDDAFAIKGLSAPTSDIVIRNGVARGYVAMVSIGSEVGVPGGQGQGNGSVRNVLVENIRGEGCGGVAFIKPDALIHDWRNGVVEGVTLRDMVLRDPEGRQFRSGVRIIAARGAVVRNVTASGIEIAARAKDRGVAPTSAVDISLLDIGAPARIEDIDLQVKFSDPYSAAPHSSASPGYPVDQVVRIEKGRSGKGVISNINLDIEGRGSSFAGVFVGPGLDGAVTLRRAVLESVAANPPSSLGAAGIWSDSRLQMGDVKVYSLARPKFGGAAFKRPGH